MRLMVRHRPNLNEGRRACRIGAQCMAGCLSPVGLQTRPVFAASPAHKYFHNCLSVASQSKNPGADAGRQHAELAEKTELNESSGCPWVYEVHAADLHLYLLLDIGMSRTEVKRVAQGLRRARCHLRALRASSSCICYENRDGPTSAQPSWPGMSRPPVVTGSRYGWPGLTMEQYAAGIFALSRGARVRAQ
jgi:hypothetical protein